MLRRHKNGRNQKKPVFKRRKKNCSSDRIKGKSYRKMCLPEMWRNSQDEIGLVGQRQAEEILPSMQNFCFIC
jgi:hypothetical protein